MSATIVKELRERQRSLKPSQVAKLLEELLETALDQGTFIFMFKQAFPAIPLRTLIEASGWSCLCTGGFDDEAFDRMLEPWIGVAQPSREE